MPQPDQADDLRASGRARALALDVARGLAVVAMVAYHTAWDLSELRLIEAEIPLLLPWRAFAWAIAASFLTISGASLALAHHGGRRLPGFRRRFAILAGAAALVTAATAVVFPQSYVFFGILHNLALSSLLALPFLRLPAAAALLASLAALGLPLLVEAASRPAWLDLPLLAWLGLATRPPLTNDYVPVFPWTGFVLFGLGLARLVRERLPLRAVPALSSPAAGLGFLGRHSLLIYLLHQPLIFGALFALVQVVGPNPQAESAPFRRTCVGGCRAQGQEPAFCEAACACAVVEMKRAGAWAAVVSGRMGVDDMMRAQAAVRLCWPRPQEN